MILPWRAVPIGDGPPIPTSLTPAEAEALRELARGRRVVEVGSAYGYSTIVVAQVAEHVWSIDPHEGYGSLFDSYPIMRANLEAYGVADRVEMIHGHAAYSALREFGATGVKPGLVFIDGDHREAGVRSDLVYALAMSRCVACHDYGEETCPDVRKVLDGRLVKPTRIVDTLWILERS